MGKHRNVKDLEKYIKEWFKILWKGLQPDVCVGVFFFFLFLIPLLPTSKTTLVFSLAGTLDRSYNKVTYKQVKSNLEYNDNDRDITQLQCMREWAS